MWVSSIKYSEHKFKICFALIVFFFSAYVFSNYVYLGSPTEVPTIFLDHLVPFMPGWIWVYLLAYPLFPFTFLTIKNQNVLHRYVVSFVLLVLFSTTIFFLFPTYIPRIGREVEDQGFLTQLAFQILRGADQPTNCIPSLHVGTGVLSVLFFFNIDKKMFLVMAIIVGLITFSTLAVKQHYALDALSGCGSAMLCYFVSTFLVKVRD